MLGHIVAGGTRGWLKPHRKNPATRPRHPSDQEARERSFEGVPATDDADAVAAEAELVLEAEGVGRAEGACVDDAVEDVLVRVEDVDVELRSWSRGVMN